MFGTGFPICCLKMGYISLFHFAISQLGCPIAAVSIDVDDSILPSFRLLEILFQHQITISYHCSDSVILYGVEAVAYLHGRYIASLTGKPFETVATQFELALASATRVSSSYVSLAQQKYWETLARSGAHWFVHEHHRRKKIQVIQQSFAEKYTPTLTLSSTDDVLEFYLDALAPFDDLDLIKSYWNVLRVKVHFMKSGEMDEIWGPLRARVCGPRLFHYVFDNPAFGERLLERAWDSPEEFLGGIKGDANGLLLYLAKNWGKLGFRPEDLHFILRRMSHAVNPKTNLFRLTSIQTYNLTS